MIDDALRIIAAQPNGDRAMRALALPASMRREQLRVAVRVADLSALTPDERIAVASELSGADALRSTAIQFRVTPDERLAIERRADAAGLELSAFLRSVALPPESSATDAVDSSLSGV